MNKELELIKNIEIKSMVQTVLDKLPDYFYEVPASSSGKYHPAFSLGKGGLIRHTKVAVRIASDLLQLEQYSYFDEISRDIIIGSLILHDGLKQGIISDGNTKFLHPLIMSNYLQELYDNKVINIEKDVLSLIQGAIASHMGQWNTSKHEKKSLKVPSSKLEQFVHLCDYLASRKYLDIKFDENNNIKEER